MWIINMFCLEIETDYAIETFMFCFFYFCLYNWEAKKKNYDHQLGSIKRYDHQLGSIKNYDHELGSIKNYDHQRFYKSNYDHQQGSLKNYDH